MTLHLKMLMPALLLGFGLSATGQKESPIIGLMNQSAENWNSANLDRFMDLYDSNATMMTPSGRVGLGGIRDLYLKYYFKDGKPLQTLTYDHYELTSLGRDYALLTGRFILAANSEHPARTGIFSLVFVHRSNGWKLLHDHSG
jgi:ketosteroid isomerase-like protein